MQAFAVIFLAMSVSRVASAAVFNCSLGNVTCLINAINTANGNGVADTINLDGSTFTLTAVNNNTDGPNGLPNITSGITINGNKSIIERSSAGGTPAFRIFHVAVGGNLTLNDLTVRNGLTPNGSNGVPDGNLDGGPAGSGGGIFNAGTLTLTNSTVSGNNTGIGGNAASNPGSGGNGGSGGGIANSGTLALTNSTVSSNNTGNGGEGNSGGGGIVNSGTLSLTNSTVSSNNAGDGGNGGPGGSRGNGGVGGGIVNGSGPLTITNSTISGNNAGNGGCCINGGGGIFNFGGTLALTSSTVSDNQANDGGGGIFNFFGIVNIKNTIVANNIAIIFDNNCSGTITNNGNNISNDASCGFGTSTGANGKTIGDNVDPLLDSAGLQNNGGPTQTIALQSTSPAIDAVQTGCPPPSTDQRGVTRPQDGDNNGTALCDIGAFEVLGNIIIGGCNTGVPDQLLGNGSTISGQINACAAGAKNHGQFVSCVSSLTNSLKKAGIITGNQKGAIQRCAGGANIP